MRIPTRSWLGLAALLTMSCTVSEPVDQRDPSGDDADDDRASDEDDATELPTRDAGKADAGKDAGGKDAGVKKDASTTRDAASDSDGGDADDDVDAGAEPPHDAGSNDGGMKPSDAGATSDAGKDASADAGAMTPSGKCPAGGFCADFEDQTGSTLSGAWSTVTPDCMGSGKLSVQGDVVHGGKRAIKVEGGGSYCDHVFAKPALPSGLLDGAVWVRLYVRFEEALGEGHTTFVSMRDDVNKSDLRMGGQKAVFMWNREKPGDAALPDLGPEGVKKSVAPAPKTWQCIEYHIDGAQGTLETYVAGKLVEGLVIDNVPTPLVDNSWLERGDFTWRAQLKDLRLGWEAYAGQKMTLFIDDIAVGATRPGC